METTQKKQTIKSVAIFVVTFAVAFFITKVVLAPSIDKKLSETANEINKTCPITVDEYTRLDHVDARSGKTIEYNYTLVNLTKAEVKIDTVKKYVVPALLNNIKTNPKMKPLRDNDVNFNYNYKDKNGALVFKYSVTPDMYK